MVVDQRLLVGVEDDVQTHVAIDVEGHLPAHGRVLRQDLVELRAGVVHHRLAAGPERYPRIAHRLGVEVGVRVGDRADPRRAVGPQFDPLLAQHGVRHRHSQFLAGVVVDGHVVQRDAQRAVLARGQCEVPLEHVRAVGHVRGGRDAVLRHELIPLRSRQQWVRDDLGHKRIDHREGRSDFVRPTVGCAIGVAPEPRPGRIGRGLVVRPSHHLDHRAVEVQLVPGVVEHTDGAMGEEDIEVGVGRLGHLLQQPIETVEHQTLAGGRLRVEFSEQRLDVVPGLVADVRRDPVCGRLGSDPREPGDGCALRRSRA